jgi:membrane-bound lytic murein transglycosylase D
LNRSKARIIKALAPYFAAAAALAQIDSPGNGLRAPLTAIQNIPESSRVPVHLTAASAVPSTAPSDRLNRAELFFQEGKEFVDAGLVEPARQSFDRAVLLLLETPEADPDRSRIERRLEEMIDLIYRYDLDNLGTGVPDAQLSFDKSPLDAIRELTFPLDPKMRSVVPKQIEVSSSQLPLETNDAVLSFINYFTTTRAGRSTLVNGWRRSTPYRPMIQRILAEEGVPQELIYLAQAESGFMPRAVSHKAAAGMWQFVRWRGQEYGLDSNQFVDWRLDPERATRAAARHLRDLFDQFGDWYLAMAAYNCGPGCVDRAVQRTGYGDYWEIRRRGALPKETSNYVPIVLAMTIVSKNAEQYGIEFDDPAPALEYDFLPVEAPTHVELVAGAADLPVSGIQSLNPALLKNVAPTGYELRVPKGMAAEIAEAIEGVPSAKRAASRLHRVKDGESLTEIATTYQTSAKTILAANSTSEDDLAAGQMLIVPASFDRPAKAPVRATSAGKSKARTAVSRTSRPAAPVTRKAKN